MKVIKIDVKGVPVAKGRPRGGKNGYYTPSKTKEYEALVRKSYERVAKGVRFQKPTAIGAIIYIKSPIPKSDTKKIKELKANNKMYNIKRGDVDN